MEKITDAFHRVILYVGGRANVVRFTGGLAGHVIMIHSIALPSNISQANVVLLGLIVLAGLAAAVLVSLGLVAFSRRQSYSYLLVVLALGTLLCKALAGGFTIVGILPTDLHHTVEHGLDFVMALLLIAAVYYARTTPRKIRNYQ